LEEVTNTFITITTTEFYKLNVDYYTTDVSLAGEYVVGITVAMIRDDVEINSIVFEY
jgi:hypothetical protein